MASQCTNGVPKCDKCYHRHWAVDTCQEFKERMAARKCYTCGEKGHVARRCKQSANSKPKKKENDVLALEDVCFIPLEDEDVKEVRKETETVPEQYYAETNEEYFLMTEDVGELTEWPTPRLTDMDPDSESDSSPDSDYERDCLRRHQQPRDVANLHPWEEFKMQSQFLPPMMDIPLETQATALVDLCPSGQSDSDH